MRASSFAFASLAVSVAYALPHTLDTRQGIIGPAIGSNFQDPSILEVDNTFYAYSGPNGNPNSPPVNIQIARSSDFSSWTVSGNDVLPNPGAWAASPPHVWAPDVAQLSNGEYVMYYAATLASNTRLHCVGVATSSSPAGPFNPASSPSFCDTGAGGAIDPSIVTDIFSGRMFVVYKVDGNSLGLSTPLVLQEISADDGITLIGGSTVLLTNQAGDGPYIEAPSLFYDGQKWVLFYNSQSFSTINYRIDHATSQSITGPYTRAGTVLQTGNGLTAPGGIDVSLDGVRVVFHSDTNLGWFNGDGSARNRAMYAIELSAIYTA